MYIINHTYTIQWVGPLSYEEYLSYINNIATTSATWFNFYYFEARKDRRYKLNRYFGVHFKNDGINKRVKASHEKIKKHINDTDFKIWIGSFSNKKAQKEINVDLVETLFISAYSGILNENNKKKKSLPSESIGVINMWFDDSDELKQYRREKPCCIDDVLLYYDEIHVYYKGSLSKLKTI